MKTANLAIVFTDIKGFTERTSRQTLEENQRLLQVHHQLLAPLFRAFGGRIVKSGPKELARELDERGYDWISAGMPAGAPAGGPA